MRLKILALFLISQIPFQASALSFRQVGFIPSGINSGSGYVKGLDINHDGLQDLVFTSSLFPRDTLRPLFYGYRPYNRYIFEDYVRPSSIFWDIGNLDGDSLIDMIVQRADTSPHGVRVFEPSDYWSFPQIPVWSWCYEGLGWPAQNMYITDLDRDSLREILTGYFQIVYVFENRGDNQYNMVFRDTSQPGVPTPPFAIGDFDGDGYTEFVRGSSGGGTPAYYLYECMGDDQYSMVWTGGVSAPNKIDGITGPDLDEDGKLEFIFGSLRNSSMAYLWIYEATGNNQYELIFSDSVSVTNRGHYTCHSDCGDVDQDGRPELVWAIDQDWMVYKSPGNNQFQRVFSAYGDNGRFDTNIHIRDMNGNGYPEIIESGSGEVGGWTYSETHIWEVEAAQVVYPNGGETLYWDSNCAIRFRNVAPFQADSFSLFFSSDSGLSYSPIARGIPGLDSTYLWTVPQVNSSQCFLMLWAYQNATGWDFSDGPFTVRPAVGVEVFPPHASRLTPYVVSPNPFVSYASVPGHEAESFALYDVSGRKVGIYKGDRIGSGLSAGIYFLKPEKGDAKPLRIVKVN